MLGGADDWSLLADFTLGFLEGTAVNNDGTEMLDNYSVHHSLS